MKCPEISGEAVLRFSGISGILERENTMTNNKNTDAEGRKPMLISQISVFLENKPGRLLAITEVLERENVDIRALSIADTTDFGILRIIANDPERAVIALKKSGFTVNTTKVIAVRIEDKPGGLHKILAHLNDLGVGVEYAYAFITRRSEDAFVVLRVEDNDRAVEYLKEKGISLLSEKEIYSL